MNSDISAILDPSAIAKEPTQARAKQRFESVLREAEVMLVEEGLQKFSIPSLAERLGMTRGSVYAYFPTPHAILNELVSRYLGELETMFQSRAQDLARVSWQDGVDIVVDEAVRFHNGNPVATLLMLGGAVTDSSYRAQEALLRRLGSLGRAIWERNSGTPLPRSPDIFTLAVEMAVACFRRSVYETGRIQPEYSRLAVLAMRQFLLPFLEAEQAVVPECHA